MGLHEEVRAGPDLLFALFTKPNRECVERAAGHNLVSPVGAFRKLAGQK
jgi:hypothetical protein